MIQRPNRQARRRSAIFDHPAYIWAIESERPQWWAIELAASYNQSMINLRREQLVGGRLTFTKFNNVEIKQVTPNAVFVRIDRNSSLFDLWIPRANIRSDDDKRCGEFKLQLDSKVTIKTHLNIADWFARKEGLK